MSTATFFLWFMHTHLLPNTHDDPSSFPGLSSHSPRVFLGTEVVRVGSKNLHPMSLPVCSFFFLKRLRFTDLKGCQNDSLKTAFGVVGSAVLTKGEKTSGSRERHFLISVPCRVFQLCQTEEFESWSVVMTFLFGKAVLSFGAGAKEPFWQCQLLTALLHMKFQGIKSPKWEL